MPTPNEPQHGRRLALVVATGTYADPTLSRLRSPGRDATELAAVLEDAAIGGFAVETLLDAPADELRRRVARFCAEGSPSDLAMVYVSCHGVLDSRGRLYYATTDTDSELLSATAIPAAWLNEQLEDCRSRRQLLVLDCCHSGAFAKGAKGPGALALRERFEGRGRVVLTASRATEYSFEGDHVEGHGHASVFTGALVEGLRSGDADRDRDGLVTVTELYEYAYDAVRDSDAGQTPTLWTYGAEGGLLVAHSPRGAVVEPVPLPDDLAALLESGRPRVREGAVGELADLLSGPDPGRALTARLHLQRMADQDIPQVADAARRALGAGPAAAAPVEPPPPPAPPARAQPEPPRPPPRRRVRLFAAGAAVLALAVVATVLLTGSPEDSSSGGGFPLATVAGAPSGVAVGEGGVWVTSHDAGRITKIDRRSRKVLATGDVGDGPLKVAAGEGAVWVSVEDGRRVVRVDPDSAKVVAEERVALEPPSCDCPGPGIVIAEGELWTADAGLGAVRRRDVDTGDATSENLHVSAGFSGAFAIGGGAVWAVGRDEDKGRAWLERVDADSGETEVFTLGAGSVPAGVTYGAGAVWIADSADDHNDVIRFDLRTEEQRRIPLADGITGDDIAFTGRSVAVWEPDGGLLTRIDARSGKVVDTVTASPYETGRLENKTLSEFAIDGVVAWVTDPVGGTVARLPLDAS